jgi:hypothetical protein
MSAPVFSRLRLPWPTRRHARAGDYRRLAAERLIATGLMTGAPHERATRRFEGSVVLDPFVYPHASLDRLLAAGAFSQWLFFLDDECDDQPELGRHPDAARAVMSRFFSIFKTGSMPEDPTPFARFSVDLHGRLSALSSKAWQKRFFDDVEDYLFRGSLACYEHWSTDRVPTLKEYEPLRMHDSAVYAAVDMIEVAAAIVLPDEVIAHPTLVEMKQITTRHVAFVNDLFSFQKEVMWHGSPWNIVTVLMHDGERTFEEAVAAAVALVNSDVARFLELEQQLPKLDSSLDAQVDSYVDGMKIWMRGNVDYALASTRYRSPDSPFLELRGGPPADEHTQPSKAA